MLGLISIKKLAKIVGPRARPPLKLPFNQTVAFRIARNNKKGRKGAVGHKNDAKKVNPKLVSLMSHRQVLQLDGLETASEAKRKAMAALTDYHPDHCHTTSNGEYQLVKDARAAAKGAWTKAARPAPEPQPEPKKSRQPRGPRGSRQPRHPKAEKAYAPKPGQPRGSRKRRRAPDFDFEDLFGSDSCGSDNDGDDDYDPDQDNYERNERAKTSDEKHKARTARRNRRSGGSGEPKPKKRKTKPDTKPYTKPEKEEVESEYEDEEMAGDTHNKSNVPDEPLYGRTVPDEPESEQN